MGNFGQESKPKPEPNRLTNPHIANQRDMAQAVFDRYDTDNPIAIVPVKGKQDTYVVLLSGTEPVNLAQATTAPEDVAASLNLNDRYRENVMHALDESGIKKSDKLIFAGHSLGGMEAQNIVADENFKKKYHATEVVTFGSPKTAPEQDGVTYHRFTTVGDPVPKLSPGSATGLDAGHQVEVTTNRLRDVQKFSGGRDIPADINAGIGQHMSYPNNGALKQYEVNGKEGLTLDTEHMRVFGARRDPTEEYIQRMGRQIGAQTKEIAETYQKQHAHAAAAPDPKAAERRRAMVEQMREQSGRTGPSESHQESHTIRRGGH